MIEFLKQENEKHQYLYLFRTFLLIGSTSFGGYMSLIAMVRNKMVIRDKCITDDVITEGISLASMLPGPTAVNVVTYVGFRLGGLTGGLLSLVAVLLPSFALVLFLTWAYLHAGDTARINEILKGVIPVVAGIIFATGLSIGQKTCITWKHYAIAAASLIVVFFLKSYWSIMILLIASALAGIALFDSSATKQPASSRSVRSVVIWLLVFAVSLVVIIFISSGTMLGKICGQFSVVSLSLFGGGYVMIPMLKSMLVDQLGWITNQEFVYGISIGQITPGPILISATFFGYKMAGIAGAIVATGSIFIPSAILMLLLSVIFDAIQHNRMIQASLAGIKPCVVGLILYSGISIVMINIRDANPLLTVAITIVSFILVFRYQTSNVLLIIGGAILGLFL